MVTLKGRTEKEYAWIPFLIATVIFFFLGCFCLMIWGAGSGREFNYAVEKLVLFSYLFASLGFFALSLVAFGWCMRTRP